MNCTEVEERDVPELYLLDRLTEAERDEFEKHYFECASCFAQLQAGLMVQAELQHQPLMRTQTGGASLRRAWAWTPAFVTVVLLLAVGVGWYSARNRLSPQTSSSRPDAKPEGGAQSQPSSPTAPSLEELAQVRPPAYKPVVLRGAEDEAHEAFRKAMQYYVKGDYVNATPGLRIAVKASPRTARFGFYLGACYLLTDQTDLAVESFHRTISLGEPAYSEPAHFYLAKAYLRKKNIPAAENELEATIQIHGNNEGEARKILRQLRE
jgi:TolA-binding protein